MSNELPESGPPEGPATIPYFLVLLKPDIHHRNAELHAQAHFAFVDRLVSENVLLLGGPFAEDFHGAESAYLLHAPTPEAAETFARQDPLVLHRVCSVDVVQWDLIGVNVDAIDPQL